MQGDMFAIAENLARSDEDEADVVNDASLHQFFTPSWAADLLFADVARGQNGLHVLEPCAGDGRLIAAIGPEHHVFGVEVDPAMAARARSSTGRDVICADIRDVDLSQRPFDTVFANPPFMPLVIDHVVELALSGMPEEGVVGLVLPAHIPASSARMERWCAHFSVETRLLPRSLFPRLRLPLVWTRMVKSRRRTLVGCFLFAEAADVHDMPANTRRALQAGRTWRSVVREALATLGGEADLRTIYAAVEPRRRSSNRWWRDKVRQILGTSGEFERVDATRWRLAA